MVVKSCERVGSCNVDRNGSITEQQREFFGQGWIFKDWKAFRDHQNAPCYVPELSDTFIRRKISCRYATIRRRLQRGCFMKWTGRVRQPLCMNGRKTERSIPVASAAGCFWHMMCISVHIVGGFI